MTTGWSKSSEGGDPPLEAGSWRGARKTLCLEKETDGRSFQDKEEKCPPARGAAPPLDPPLYFRTCTATVYPGFIQRRNRTRVFNCDSSKCTGSGSG